MNGFIGNENLNDSKYSEIARALADKYEVIYYVNIKTNEYEEYSASMEYARLKISTIGKDFFAEAQENMKRDIYPEDYPMMAAAMQKDAVLKGIEETGKYFLNYRLILDGAPQYVTLSAVRAEDRDDHMIFAVANVDAEKRKEADLRAIVDEALEFANHDSLTGAGNKRYYFHKEQEMDAKIADGTQSRFAIIVCDINELKKVNDSYGHSTGDAFIVNACRSISDVFAQSNIYRYGGDEFVVVLEEGDYENRFKLIEEFDRQQIVNLKDGKATVSYGMSEFNKDTDERMRDVFERADKEMYSNKRAVSEKFDELNRVTKEKTEQQIMIDGNVVEFYNLFSKLISAMTDLNNPNIPIIENLLIDISSMFRLSKAVTRVFKNLVDEEAGVGETLCCYDTGKAGDEIMSFRVVNTVQSVVTMHVYMSPDEEPLTEDERWRVDLVMRATVCYISRNRLKQRVDELTFYDEYGYRNLRSFYKYVMTEAAKQNMAGKAVIRYNLRHFTLVNKELGKTIGDKVIKSHFRTLEDIIGDEGIVCRLGGDNFICVCGERQTGNVLNYLTEASVVYDSSEGKCVSISTSAGVFRVPKDYEIRHPGDVMGKTITAYQIAQNGGKERIVFYDTELLRDKEKNMKVQQMFPEALRKEEFAVYYQPKVNIETGELIGAEALCRWIHDGQVISPADFIPMLEETDDICKLDFYVLEHVCRDIHKWMKEGKHVVRVSVNLSRKHMINRNLLNSILKIVDRHEIPHSLIEIELTETTSDVGFSDLKRVVNGLQTYGICTAVDDFGVGYSSLNLLRELPWNVIKIDRSFLPTDEEEDVSSRNIMFKYVVAMAQELGMECIVEGVENNKQLKLLQDNNCDFAQGFMFDKPLPKKEFEKRIERRYYSIKGD